MSPQEIPFHLVFETSRDAILLFDRHRCIEYNSAAKRLFDIHDRQAFLAQVRDPEHDAKNFGQTDFHRYEATVFEAFYKADFLFEWRYVNKTGQEITLETAIRAFESGHEIIIMANARDISLHIQQQSLDSRERGPLLRTD